MFRAILQDGHGRRFLRQVLHATGAEAMSDAQGLEQLAATAALRNLGLLIRERCQLYDPKGWLRFEAEYLQERENALRAADQIAQQTVLDTVTP